MGISVNLARYVAKVHYTDCAYWSDTYHHAKLALPPTISFQVCSFCSPTPADVVAVAGEVRWLHKTADVMSRPLRPLDDVAEKRHDEFSVNGGRTLRAPIDY